jgi:virginiamycin A acetyltransferase
LVAREAIKLIQGNLIEKDFAKKRKITISYGRHSYGPQPILLGYMPWVAIKAQGTKIGNFCSLGSNVKFSFLGKHNYRNISTYPFYDFYDRWGFDTLSWHGGKPDTEKIEPNPIIIENDVWIANDVIIKEGIKICNGAVIALGSLVTKNVPPYALVGGNPAKIIKYRFNEEQINSLLKIAWWNWTDSKIKSLIPLILSEDVESFIEAAEVEL